jgi:hypothetical protein
MRSLMSDVTTVVMLASITACAPSTEGAVNKPESSVASSEPPTEPRAKLAPAPASRPLGQFWPTKICTRGANAIVVSNSCVCDSKMTCSVTRKGTVLDLHVVMTQDTCKDCGTFAATCTVPPEVRSAKTLRLTIDGKPVLDVLDLPRSNAPAKEHCYD